MYSTSEENYLKAIYKISEHKGIPVSTNSIAEEMHTTPASVSDMVKKLAEKELVNYEKYRGVDLSKKGMQLATALIRKHRLWECFLVYKLNFSWDEVHEIAEQLEHVRSTSLVDRLDQFLEYPRFDPHGDPIPDKDGKFTFRKQYPLEQLHAGEEGIVLGVQNHSKAFLQYLSDLKIELGSHIKVLQKFDFDHSMKIKVGKSEIHVSPTVSMNVYVRKK
jgi:DtxR family Mn-dependent transcriptional regulator